MIFSAAILVSALLYGAPFAYFATFLSFVIFHYYYLEPRFEIKFERVDDFTVLIGFLLVSLLAGSLAGRIRKEAERNQLLAATTAKLFEASRKFSQVETEDEIRAILIESIAGATSSPVVLVDAGQSKFFPASFKMDTHLLKGLDSVAGLPGPNGHFQAPDPNWVGRTLRPQDKSLGYVAWRSGDHDQQIVDVMVDLGAAAISRARLSRERTEVDTLARTQRLRDALLSSISHDLRTPLAAIIAAASSLREFGEKFSRETWSDLLGAIEEEAQRLNRFVANLLSMTRLESGMVTVDRHAFAASEVINRVADRARRSGREVSQNLEGSPITIEGDPLLFEQALENVVENALRYSAPGGEITINARELGRDVAIEVADEGSGVPAGEFEMIFDKFYRSPTTANIQGTGLGLSITRGLVMSMNGNVRAKERLDGRPGLVVEFTLPKGEASLA